MPKNKRQDAQKFDSRYDLKAHIDTKHSVNPTPEGPGETFIKGISFLGFSGGYPSVVDVKNDKIVRIRPLHYDWKYQPEDYQPWRIKARGKVFEAPRKTLPSYLSLGYKKRVYSPNRIKYPLKRVDWDPNGERNPQNRGKSKFQRITWDEALNIIASEIKRIHAKYDPYAILCQGDGHGESKTYHCAHGAMTRLLALAGGYTLQVRNPDSWEGWWWGAKHMWGEGWQGMMEPQTNVFQDVSENTDMLLFWGCDPETTPFMGEGYLANRACRWFRALGIKQIYICPDLNYAAAIHADKWIPVLPNTDAALHLAVSYVWITEGTYDQDYVATHTFGFDKYQDYVLGKEDGVPKTPQWASPLCGVPEWTIKALAREWASKATSIAHFCGGCMIRGPYSTEPARLEVCNLTMQGVGKPGIHQVNRFPVMPEPTVSPNVRAAKPELTWGWGHPHPKQHVTKVFIPKAILEASQDKPLSWYSTTMAGQPVEDQFVKYQYPVEGCSEIHMVWTDAPCWTTCWCNDGTLSLEEALRSSKIEFVLAEHMWLENDCLFADIILPINTKLEEEDIGVGGDLSTIYLEKRCIEPLGESMSDIEAVGEIAKRLGLYDKFMENKTPDEWLKQGYELSGVKDMVSWQELNEKQYYVVPTRPGWEKDPAGLRQFYEEPEKNPLKTKSGKIEFYAQWLSEHFPDDKERPPVPHWVTGGPGWQHDERLSGERCQKYPLLLVSNHPHWRLHATNDDNSWLREIQTCKIKGPDGYLYEPLWIHPTDAAKRGIKQGDLVKMYNERGTVLGGAYVTERIKPGALMQDHGSRLDLITDSFDRGGNNNILMPWRTTSPKATGMVCSGVLVEVEKVTEDQMAEWRKKYPEAFEREYDPAAGLCFNSWVEGGV